MDLRPDFQEPEGSSDAGAQGDSSRARLDRHAQSEERAGQGLYRREPARRDPEERLYQPPLRQINRIRAGVYSSGSMITLIESPAPATSSKPRPASARPSRCVLISRTRTRRPRMSSIASAMSSGLAAEEVPILTSS